MKYCSKCGTQLKDTDRFCFSCGTKVEDTTSAAVNADESLTKKYVPAIVEEFKKAGNMPDYYRISMMINKIREQEPSKQLDALQEIAFLYSRLDALYHNLGIETKPMAGNNQVGKGGPMITDSSQLEGLKPLGMAQPTTQAATPVAKAASSNSSSGFGSNWKTYAGMAAASFGGTFLASELSHYLNSPHTEDVTYNLTNLDLPASTDSLSFDHLVNSDFTDLGFNMPEFDTSSLGLDNLGLDNVDLSNLNPANALDNLSADASNVMDSWGNDVSNLVDSSDSSDGGFFSDSNDSSFFSDSSDDSSDGGGLFGGFFDDFFGD